MKRWRPEHSKYYYFIQIDDCGFNIIKSQYCEPYHGWEEINFKYNNCFKTLKDANFVLRCLKQSFKKNNWCLEEK